MPPLPAPTRAAAARVAPRQPPPPLGLALGFGTAAAAVFLAADCEASAVGLQLWCSTARFLTAESTGAVAGAVALVVLAHGAAAMLLLFAAAAIAHRWRRLSPLAPKAAGAAAAPAKAAPAVHAAAPAAASQAALGGPPRAVRMPVGTGSPRAAGRRAITDARALEAYLSSEEMHKRKRAAVTANTDAQPSLLAGAAAPGASMTATTSFGSSGGRAACGASMPLQWPSGAGRLGSPLGGWGFAGSPPGATGPGGAPSPGMPLSYTGPAYGSSPPFDSVSPLGAGFHSRLPAGGLGSHGGRGAFSYGVGSPPHGNGSAYAAASPYGAAASVGAPPFGTSPCGVLASSPFAAASSPTATAFGGVGFDASRRISAGSAGGGSASKYQRAMYIPSSGDRQQDPSVIARRATRLLRALKLLDESVERGSTLSR